MEKTILAFRGNRDVWLEFTHTVRKEKKEVWEVLEPIIESYLKKKK